MDLQSIQRLADIVGSPVKGGGNNVLLRCPMAATLHKSGYDRNPSLSVKVGKHGERSLAYCFSCGVKGTLLGVFEGAEEAIGGFKEAVEFIKDADAGDFASELSRIMGSRRCSVVDGHGIPDYARYAARCYGKIPQCLIDRGVTLPDVVKWRIGYDETLVRSVFPVTDENGRVVGALRRAAAEGQQPKYFDTPGLPKRQLFYGENMVDQTRGVVHIVEGPTDAIFASRVLPNVLGLMGAHTGMGKDRIRKLLKWCRSVVLILDGDQAGDAAASDISGALRKHFSVRVVRLPEGEDPASVGSRDLLRAVSLAEVF